MPVLDTIMATFEARFGPAGPLYVVGALGAILIVLALLMLGKKSDDPLDRLKREMKGARAQAEDPDRPTLRTAGNGPKLDRFANFLEPKDAEEMSAARLKMLRAGYRSKDAVRMKHAAQFVLGIAAIAMGMAYALLNAGDGGLSPQIVALAVVLPGAIGYWLPNYWVERRVQERQKEILQGFPDALDLMLVCVEAGQSLDQAILRVSKEIRAGYPALADEFETVSQQTKAGKDRVTVLKDMSERAGVADVSSFVTVMVQSAQFGTSIGDALRVYAEEMRDKRVMRAEEKANVLPTKLTLGTMMFTVPPLMIILIGPSVMSIMEAFGGK